LRMKGQLAAEGLEKMPQDFLMEMMELNELVMELEFEFEESHFEKAQNIIQQLEKEVFNEVESILVNYDEATASEEDYKKIKNFYLKNKYLLRIQKSLATFAPH
jgi:molecular chaperone HscB